MQTLEHTDQVFDWYYKYANVGLDQTEIYNAELNNLVENLIDIESLTASKFYSFYENSFLETYCPEFYKHLAKKQLTKFFKGFILIIAFPGNQLPIHIDDNKDNVNQIGLNLPVRNCENSYTVWYKNLGPAEFLDPDYSGNVDTFNQAPQWNTIDAEEITRVEITKPLWINSGVPHTAVSYNSGIRIAISLRFDTLLQKILKKSNEFFL
jgi:hypothetical protein